MAWDGLDWTARNENDDFIYMKDFEESIKTNENKYAKSFEVIVQELGYTLDELHADPGY